MTPYMQFRLWLRDASRAERAVTGIVLTVIAALLVVSVAARPDGELDQERSSLAGDVTDESVAQQDGAQNAGGAPLPNENAPAAGGTAPAAVAPSGSTSPGNSGGGPGAPGPAGAPAASGARSSGPVRLTASDRGVTEREIKLGFMLQNTAGLNSSGFSTGQRTDGPQYIRALVDYANRNGGAAGRRVTSFFRYTDPTNVGDAAAACQAMVNDQKVFGVVDVASIVDTGGIDCIANRGNTPYVHSVQWSREWQRRSRGNDVSYQAAIDRISITWARDLAAAGWLGKDSVVGILGDKCPATEPTIVGVLKPALERAGAKEVVIGNHDCTIEAVASQPPNIATRFRLSNVNRVLIVSNFVSGQVFLSSAASQGYRPQYSTSDWFLLSGDATTRNYDPNQFDGAIGITSLGTMLPSSGKPPYPGWERCSRVATEAKLPPVDHAAASNEILSLCDNFFLMIDAINAAGPNPTRGSWVRAMEGLGQHPSAVFGPSRFAPGKLSGSDQVHTVRWQRGCRCWKSVSGFRPAAA